MYIKSNTVWIERNDEDGVLVVATKKVYINWLKW